MTLAFALLSLSEAVAVSRYRVAVARG